MFSEADVLVKRLMWKSDCERRQAEDWSNYLTATLTRLSRDRIIFCFTQAIAYYAVRGEYNPIIQFSNYPNYQKLSKLSKLSNYLTATLTRLTRDRIIFCLRGDQCVLCGKSSTTWLYQLLSTKGSKGPSIALIGLFHYAHLYQTQVYLGSDVCMSKRLIDLTVAEYVVSLKCNLPNGYLMESKFIYTIYSILYVKLFHFLHKKVIQR